MFSGRWEMKLTDPIGNVIDTEEMTFEEAWIENANPSLNGMQWKLTEPEYEIISDKHISLITQERFFRWFPELRGFFEHFIVDRFCLETSKDGEILYVRQLSKSSKSVLHFRAEWKRQFEEGGNRK